jgi:MarR family 2-MHQ and catechol resistance regulon transcriptional repressor
MDETAAITNRGDRLLALVHRTSRTSRQLRRRLGELAAGSELTDGELLVIWLCSGDAEGLIQGELAEAIGISPAQMSSVAERLRQRGLLAMERSPLDRRRQVWRSTPAGRGLLAALQLQLLALAQQFEAFVPPADQQAAIALCEQLAAAADACSSVASSLPIQEAA